MKRRRLAAVALGLGLALLALEAALQVGAFVLWSRRGQAARGALLCAGDSFTYGLGATGGDGGSYPRQLEGLLRARGGDDVVVNGGWPGQSSREVLLRLPEQLARHRPARVLVLAGINDPWARPAPVRDAELAAPAASGFPMRLRLRQVFVMMADWLRAEGPSARPFVGTWHAGDFEVTFEAGGRLLLGKDEVRWLEDEIGVVLVLPARSEPMQWAIEQGRLSVRAPSFAHVLEPGPAPAPSALVRGNKALASGDVATAKALLQAALAVAADAPAAREALVRIAVQEGDAGARARWLAELRAACAQDPGSAGAALAQALAATGSTDEAIDVAERVLADRPDDLRAWDVLLAHGLAAGARARVLQCMERVLARARGDEAWRPSLLQMRATLRRQEDAAAALHDLCLAFLQNGDQAFLQRQVELGRAEFGPAVHDAALARLTPDDAARVRAALAADTGESGVRATLRAHLERIVALCRQHGAEVCLLSYPEPDAPRDALVAGVAAATGARYLSLHERFAALLQTTPRDVLFIKDGHCTDRGYGEMAAQVAAALR